MSIPDVNTENLTIGKKDFLVKIVELNQAELKFYPENPRVYSLLNNSSVTPSQEEIESLMTSMDHVKQLKLSIESNGGLIDPLIVKDGDLLVLEGNSRLAAYRLLCIKDPIKWGKVRCKVLPSDIGEDSIFALLGQYHIIGRKDWDPYEQANYLYRRHNQTKLPIQYMAQELGLSKQKAESIIHVVETMIKNDDLNKRHWSYYEEYLKNSALKKYRETNPDIDETILKSIKNEEIREAADIRKLGDVAKIGDKQSKKAMLKVSTGDYSIYDAYNEVLEAGKLEDVVLKLKNFRTLINSDTFEKQLSATPETQENAKFELKKIVSRLNKIVDKLK